MGQLTEILQHIQKRPGMYLLAPLDTDRSIHLLYGFILGFQTGQHSLDKSNELDCFHEWIGLHYRTLVDNQAWIDLILEHVSNDSKLAFDEFFRLLPAFLKDRQELGRDGIVYRFSVLQEELWKQFERDLQKE